MLSHDSVFGKMVLTAAVKTALKKPTQEQIVAFVTLVLFLIFSILIKGFANSGNLITLIRNVAVLGILSTGMGLVVIARGIDLSQVTVMAVASAWVLLLLQNGVAAPIAILLGLALAVIVGGLNGFLIAFIEIPALFATLASGFLTFGIVGLIMLKGEGYFYIPETSRYFLQMGSLNILGIPLSVIIFGLVAFLAHRFLLKISYGRFVYAHGDTSEAAGLTGIAVRPLTILEYTLCALIGYLAGLLRAATVGQVDLRIVNSTLIFDVILVVVVGGISLIGGRGSIWSVILGTALIGTLLNGMTMMNIPNDLQNIIKSLALLGALIIDNRLHPRDEETARQGDI